MTPTFRRDRTAWLCYLMLAFYGYFLNVLGPITPFLKQELNLTDTMSSLHFTAFAVGILLIGVGGHLVIAQLGRWWSLWIGAAGMSLGVLLLLVGRDPMVTIAAAFLMGLVGSLILAIVPAALADQYGEQRAIALSEANVISSLVATSAALMVGWSVNLVRDWRAALGIVALTPIVLFVMMGKGARPITAASEKAEKRQPLPILYWTYWVAIVLAVSIEFCMIFWSADYNNQVLGLSRADAAQAVSLFLLAMILGRLAGSRLVQRFPTRPVVLVSILLASLGFLLFWSAGSVLVGLTGLFFTGLGVAALYPLILSLAIGAAPDNTVQASARATLASGTAILALPLVLGRLADAMGIRMAYGVVVLLLVSVFVIIQSVGKAKPAREPVVD